MSSPVAVPLEQELYSTSNVDLPSATSDDDEERGCSLELDARNLPPRDMSESPVGPPSSPALVQSRSPTPPPLRPSTPYWQLESVAMAREKIDALMLPLQFLYDPVRPEYEALESRLHRARHVLHGQRVFLQAEMERPEDLFSNDEPTPGERLRDYYDKVCQWDRDVEVLLDERRRLRELQVWYGDLNDKYVATKIELEQFRALLLPTSMARTIWILIPAKDDEPCPSAQSLDLQLWIPEHICVGTVELEPSGCSVSIFADAAFSPSPLNQCIEALTLGAAGLSGDFIIVKHLTESREVLDMSNDDEKPATDALVRFLESLVIDAADA